MAQNDANHFNYRAFIARHGGTVEKYLEGQTVYRQGDPADALFYMVSGTAKVSVNSEFGKEAVIAILGAGAFFGERSLDDVDQARSATIITANACEIARFDRSAISRALDTAPAFAKQFLLGILESNDRLQADLTDRLFNTSEKRLARILLTLANIEPGTESSVIAIPLSQEMLANMVGTTRSRVNLLMNKFRKLGYIEYNGEIRVRRSLNLALQDPA
jgi:CRP/FNR family transcriptional regulator, cyclic AMP receptor protein